MGHQEGGTTSDFLRDFLKGKTTLAVHISALHRVRHCVQSFLAVTNLKRGR